MSIFGKKSSLGVLLRLMHQGYALSDEDAHPPFLKWASSMTILLMSIFQPKALSHRASLAMSLL